MNYGEKQNLSDSLEFESPIGIIIDRGMRIGEKQFIDAISTLEREKRISNEKAEENSFCVDLTG